MNRNTQSDNSSMSPAQKQAALVCGICALAVLITASVTWTLIRRKGGSAPPASSVVTIDEGDLSDYYQIDETSGAILPE